MGFLTVHDPSIAGRARSSGHEVGTNTQQRTGNGDQHSSSWIESDSPSRLTLQAQPRRYRTQPSRSMGVVREFMYWHGLIEADLQGMG